MVNFHEATTTYELDGLPLEALIGGPLQAAHNAEAMLAAAASDVVEKVSLDPEDKITEGNV